MLRTLVWEASGDDDSAPAPYRTQRARPWRRTASPGPPTGRGGRRLRSVASWTTRWQISDLLERRTTTLWLDGPRPRGELRLIAEEFSLHPLAVEDAAEHSQRLKIDQYDGFYLMVVFAITAINADARSAPPGGRGRGAGRCEGGRGRGRGAVGARAPRRGQVRLHEIGPLRQAPLDQRAPERPSPPLRGPGRALAAGTGG